MRNAREDAYGRAFSILEGVPRFALALFSLGAATIHFAVIDEHLDEYWLFGVFFIVAAIAQTAWVLLVLTQPSRTVLAAGLVGNLAIIAIWILSRTVGVPVGPEAGERESIELADALSTIYEALIVLGTLPLLWHKMAGRRVVPARGVPLRLLTITVVPLTGLSLYLLMC